MKIIGTKYEGQESSICYLNTDKEVFFALNSDRVSRIKKDNLDIEQLLNYTKKKNIIKNDVDIVAVPFSNFSGNDAILGMQCPTYFWLKKEKIKRQIIKPIYYKDLLKKISFKKKLNYLINPKWVIFSFLYLILTNFRKSRFLNSFFVKLAIKYIFKKQNVKIKRIDFFDHHLCHAA